jgi:maleylacetoacetate isomerase/maleylpyruvate isomerase
MALTLFAYFRSSASWRVRMALALKGLPYDYRGVHLVRNVQHDVALGGEAQQVPSLILGDGTRLTQSLAILDYLEEVHPHPPLLPTDPVQRAFVRSLAQDIACDVHPLQNLRVLRHLVGPLKLDEDAKTAWARHWIERGLAVVDARLRASPHFGGRFCQGDEPGYADCVLLPQVFNARRFGADLSALSAVQAVTLACEAHALIAATHPSQCPDAE